jgi:F-type H+-transporting ATPase subunit b
MLERATVRAIGETGRTALLLAALLILAQPSHAAGDLVLVPSPPLLVALIVLFALLVLPVNTLVFKPIFKILDEREARTTGTREQAEQIERDAQEILDRYEASVQAVRAEAEQTRRAALEAARSDSQGTANDARAEAEREIEQARNQIGNEFEAARTALRSQSQDLARQAASSVLGRVL